MAPFLIFILSLTLSVASWAGTGLVAPSTPQGVLGLYPVTKPEPSPHELQSLCVREEERLPELNLIELPQSEKAAKSCDKLAVTLKAMSRQLDAEQAGIRSFVREAANVYGRWRDVLVAKEATETNWPAGYFLPLQNSVGRLEGSSNALYQTSNDMESWGDDVVGLIESCWTGKVPDLSAVRAAFHEFQYMHMEHITSAANFLSLMQSRLSKNTVSWRRMEGQVTEPPTGFFDSLSSEKKYFIDADQLLFENGQSVAIQYQRFMNLTP